MSFYDYSATLPDGKEQKMDVWKGKVVLVVNTATECGFTPQYKEIEELYGKYKDQGLVVLDFPCNQFGGQAPGSDQEIASFCSLKFHTTFPRYHKIEVNGKGELPLYTYLKSKKGFAGFDPAHPITPILVKILTKADPDWKEKSDIKWNFTKFLIDRKGNVVKRFEPTEKLSHVEEAVKGLL